MQLDGKKKLIGGGGTLGTIGGVVAIASQAGLLAGPFGPWIIIGAILGASAWGVAHQIGQSRVDVELVKSGRKG